MAKKRRVFSSKQKAKIALEALKERESSASIAAKHSVHPNQISQWKKMGMEGIENAFQKIGKADKKLAQQAEKMDDLYREIGQLQVELNWLKKKYGEL